MKSRFVEGLTGRISEQIKAPSHRLMAQHLRALADETATTRKFIERWWSDHSMELSQLVKDEDDRDLSAMQTSFSITFQSTQNMSEAAQAAKKLANKLDELAGKK